MPMTKKLNDFLSEVDEEYSLEIFASFNIHREETLTLISSALFKYDLRGEIELGCAKTMTDHPKEFPYLDMAAVYSVKASLGIVPLDLAAVLQEISVVLKRKQDAFAAKIDGGELVYAKRAEYEPNLARIAAEDPVTPTKLSWPISDGKPEDTQKLVGQNRVSTLLSKLSTISKERNKPIADRTKAIMTHLGLKDVLGESRKKGYYKVELQEGKLRVEGPFQQRPLGSLIDNKRKFESFMRGQLEEEELSAEQQTQHPDKVPTEQDFKAICEKIETIWNSDTDQAEKSLSSFVASLPPDSKLVHIPFSSFDLYSQSPAAQRLTPGSVPTRTSESSKFGMFYVAANHHTLETLSTYEYISVTMYVSKNYVAVKPSNVKGNQNVHFNIAMQDPKTHVWIGKCYTILFNFYNFCSSTTKAHLDQQPKK